MNRKYSPSKVNHDRWLVSYADFITLLFAFFVVLYAFSKADEKKQTQVSAAIDSAFRALSIAPGAREIATADLSRRTVSSRQISMAEAHLVATATFQGDLEDIRRDLEQRLALQISNHTVSVQLGRDGLVVSLREAGFFNSGSAVPRPETILTLEQIAGALRSSPYDIRVEGHTDNVPIHNAEFDSNWGLSSARAVRIARMFLELRATLPEQLSAAGFAGYRPVADNATAEGRAKNRRVDIVVMPRTVLDIATEKTTDDTSTWRKITDQ